MNKNKEIQFLMTYFPYFIHFVLKRARFEALLQFINVFKKNFIKIDKKWAIFLTNVVFWENVYYWKILSKPLKIVLI